MKTICRTLFLGVAVSSLVSCSQPLQPRQDVEAAERAPAITPMPDVGQQQAGRNAVDYANDRRYGYGPYGSGNGYRY